MYSNVLILTLAQWSRTLLLCGCLTLRRSKWSTSEYDDGHADHRNITYVPGFFKIFDEILVNAADNKVIDIACRC